MGRLKLLLPILVTIVLSAVAVLGTEPSDRPYFTAGQPMIAGEKVVMTWSPIPGAKSYRVHLNGALLDTVNGTSFITSLPEVEGIYSYQVSALLGDGRESELSMPGSVQVRRVAPPGNLYAQVVSRYRSVDILWDVVPEAVNYRVYRGEAGEALVEVGVTADHTYRDRNVRAGVWYVYAVSSVDVSGKEGPRSRELDVEIDPFSETASDRNTPAVPLNGRHLSVEELLNIDSINGTPLDNVSYLGAGDYGGIWVVVPSAREIHQLDSSGKAVFTAGGREFGRREKNIIPHKMDVGPEGRIYVSDVKQGTVACLDSGGQVVWKLALEAPDRSNILVWNGFPDSYPDLDPAPSSILSLPQEIWVTDQRFQLIYRVSHDGKLLGYITHYRKNNDVWRFRRIGEVGLTSEGVFLVTFPLVNKIIGLDETLSVAFEVDGSRMSGVQRLFSVHGIQAADDGRLLITDPARGIISVYRARDGAYMNYIAGRDAEKAMVLNKPAMSVFDSKGRIWVSVEGEDRIAVFRPAGADE